MNRKPIAVISTDCNNIEVWKDILGFDFDYKVSNLGRIYAPYRNRIMKPSSDNFGYLRVNLRQNKVSKLQMVHKLVAIAFIKNNNQCIEINHRDNNPQNNNVNNLEWVSSRENATYRSNSNNRTSIYTGVSWDKGKQRWRSTIYSKGKQIFIGRFDDEKEASLAYENKLIELNDVNKYMICSKNQ